MPLTDCVRHGGEDAARCDSADALLPHLDGIEAIMTSHFRFEERQLVDLLDAVTDDAVPLAPLLGIGPPKRWDNR